MSWRLYFENPVGVDQVTASSAFAAASAVRLNLGILIHCQALLTDINKTVNILNFCHSDSKHLFENIMRNALVSNI